MIDLISSFKFVTEASCKDYGLEIKTHNLYRDYSTIILYIKEIDNKSFITDSGKTLEIIQKFVQIDERVINLIKSITNKLGVSLEDKSLIIPVDANNIYWDLLAVMGSCAILGSKSWIDYIIDPTIKQDLNIIL